MSTANSDPMRYRFEMWIDLGDGSRGSIMVSAPFNSLEVADTARRNAEPLYRAKRGI